jgi:hypothetical protein
MNTQKDVIDLLETSLDEMRAGVLPHLSGSARTTGLMVANALAIALRILESGTRYEVEELQGLQALLDDPSKDIGTLRRRLVQQIRAGEVDPLHRPLRAARLVSHLALTTTSQCAIDQPKALMKASEVST